MRNPTTVAVGLGLVGAVVATVLGLLTFGAQATVAPDHLPLAVATRGDPVSRQAATQIASHGGDAVEWRVTDPEEARRLLDDKEVYGVLQLDRGITILTSGAVNPQGTQVAQQVMTGAAQGLAAAMAQQGVQVAPPKVVTVHEASTAGRAAPLAASALLWIGGLAVIGLMKLWDSSLSISTDVIGFMLLVAVAFSAVQGALVRLLRLRAAAILGPMYLLAPAVAGAVPEMLDPAYRAVLWSWTPFRFSTEGLRSVLLGVPDAPDVQNGLIVLASMAVAGLVVLLWPTRRASAAPPPETARELVSSGS